MDEPTRTRTTQTIDHRTVEEERLVRAAYYANMAANLIERLDADSAGARDLLIKSGYDIVGELRHIVSWAKEERDRRFPLPMQNASDRVIARGADGTTVSVRREPPTDPRSSADG